MRNKAKLIDTFSFDGVPVSQRWAVTASLAGKTKTYFAVRGVVSGKMSIHSQHGGLLTSKVISQVLPIAKEAIEAAIADGFMATMMDALRKNPNVIVVHDGSVAP